MSNKLISVILSSVLVSFSLVSSVFANESVESQEEKKAVNASSSELGGEATEASSESAQ